MSYYKEMLKKQGITLKKEFDRGLVIDRNSHKSRKKGSAFDPVTGMRICCICLTPKDADQYTTKRSAVDGKDARCNPCKVKMVYVYRHSTSPARKDPEENVVK